MSDYGIKVSLPGNNVLTAEPEECAVHSGYPSPKIEMDTSPSRFGTLVINFTQTITQATNTLLYTLDHNLGYIPQVQATVIEDEDNEFAGLLPYEPTLTLRVWVETNSSNCKFYIYDDFNNTYNGYKLEISYYIFAEEVE